MALLYGLLKIIVFIRHGNAGSRAAVQFLDAVVPQRCALDTLVVGTLDLLAVQRVNQRFVLGVIDKGKFHFRLGRYVCPQRRERA